MDSNVDPSREPTVGLPRFTIRAMMILIAIAAIALAAWILVPPWWQYHQSIRRLTG